MGKSVNADIDTTLFGSGEKAKRIASSRSTGAAGLDKPSAIGDFFSGGGSAGTGGSRARRTMQLVSKNEVRNLTIRNPQTKPGQLVLSFADYNRIRENAVPLAQAAAALKSERAKRRSQSLAESMARKAEFEALDRAAANDDTMNELEIETKEREDEILRQARAAMENSEEEVRELKSKILQAKCMAIRDKQIAERSELAAAIKAESSSLDEMMEAIRLEGIAASERKERELKEQYIVGRRGLEEQITQRQQDRLLQEELKEQEAVARKVAYEKMVQEDLEVQQRKAEDARAKLAEAEKINQTAIQMRAVAEAAERDEDLKRAAFLKQKAEAEEAAEKAVLEEKRLKDLAFGEQLRQQERALDMRGAQDELKARRAQYEKDRKARAKELADAEAKARTLADLHAAREAQVKFNIEMRVQQAVADQRDFEQTLAAQKQLIASEKEIEEKVHSRSMKHREDVLSQIAEREKSLRQERAEFFKEGISIDEEAQLRKARINAIKERMLSDVQADGVDPRYLQDVLRSVKA